MEKIIMRKRKLPMMGGYQWAFWHASCWTPREELKEQVLAYPEGEWIADDYALGLCSLYCWQTQEYFRRDDASNPWCNNCESRCFDAPARKAYVGEEHVQ
jgi:hypothetical protein